MPSALEKLVKILKLEREQGYKNTAVIGGLRAFSEKWTQEAHTQARKPEHHDLVDELGSLLQRYEALGEKAERHQSVGYMLDRITGRIQLNRPASAPTDAPAVEPPPEPRRPERPPRTEQAPGERRSPHADKTQAREQQGGTERRKGDSRNREQRREGEAPNREQRREGEAPNREQRRETSQRQEAAPRQESYQRQDTAQPPAAKPKRGAAKPPREQRRKPERGGGDEDREVIAARELEGGADFTSLEAEFEASYRSDKGGHSNLPDIAPQPRLARPPRKARPPMEESEAADIIHGLNASVTTVRGIGPKMAETLKEVGIQSINDMLFYLPRRYDDYTQLRYVSRLRPHEVATIIGTVRHVTTVAGKSGRKDFRLVLDDGSASISVIFFGQHFLIRTIHVGEQLVLSGEVGIYSGKLQMSNPEWEHLDNENLHTTGIVPIYPLTEGLRPRALRKLMHEVVDYWSDHLPDYMPESVLERTELADLGWSIKNLHFPEGWDHLEHARSRLTFDDLLLLQMAILANRRAWQSLPAPALQVSDDFLEPFIQTVFTFPLTGAQRRAIEDIRRDVTTTIPMNRLIQGDVGSGKTAVATAALGMAFANGKQGALMAPTGILAEQHYRNISRVLERTPGERQPVVALLTSSLSAEERSTIYAGLADGSIDVVIGTHALIQQGVEFKDLAIVIVDEQHRFGVEQRKALRGKGSNPHLIVMTATPIPRTLSLTIYADLDLTIIDEMPPGRKPVQTRIVDPVARERVYDFIKAQLDQGRQAFIVHPLVEESEKVEARAALQAFEELKEVFFRYRVGLLHGRMKPAEKDEAMHAFTAHQWDILVTTSVAEVGVDVPNASVIVIESADRFGLAQLHQFRGRVGRGEHPSYCLLISDNLTDDAQARLKALEETTDGFKLAEIDWKLRGPGDLLGTSQSGRQISVLAPHMSPHLVEMAQREARTLYEEDPELSRPEHRLLAERVQMLHNERSDVS
ncbi:MAG: ATP-dependent DNA helicase RecG [Anaerolineae bacterium]